MRVSILGAGSWGTTIANMLAEKGCDAYLWVRRDELLRDISEYRENRQYLPGVQLHEGLNLTDSIGTAVYGSSVVIIVVPSNFVREVVTQISGLIGKDVIIVSASKGIENDTLLTVSQILQDVFPKELHDCIAVLSGPSFAKEVSSKLPTAVCVASIRDYIAKRIQQIFSAPFFRVYTSQDMMGVELGGALKNVIAMASGVSDGLKLGTNARAALITRGLTEMTRLGQVMGARSETMYGLAGLGDLVLTCTGELSRNRYVGFSLGEGKRLYDISSEMNMIAEGIKTSKSVYNLAKQYGVDMPITEKVYQILYEDKSPRMAVTELMARGLKKE